MYSMLTHFKGFWNIINSIPFLRNSVKRYVLPTRSDLIAAHPLTRCTPHLQNWEAFSELSYYTRAPPVVHPWSPEHEYDVYIFRLALHPPLFQYRPEMKTSVHQRTAQRRNTQSGLVSGCPDKQVHTDGRDPQDCDRTALEWHYFKLKFDPDFQSTVPSIRTASLLSSNALCPWHPLLPTLFKLKTRGILLISFSTTTL